MNNNNNNNELIYAQKHTLNTHTMNKMTDVDNVYPECNVCCFG